MTKSCALAKSKPAANGELRTGMVALEDKSLTRSGSITGDRVVVKLLLLLLVLMGENDDDMAKNASVTFEGRVKDTILAVRG